MSRRTPIKELLEEESASQIGSPRRSSRIAAVVTRRTSATEEAAPVLGSKITRSRRLSATRDPEKNSDDRIGSSNSLSTPSKNGTRSASKSPTTFTKMNDAPEIPIKRTRSRSSLSNPIEKTQQEELGDISKPKSFRSVSISPTSELGSTVKVSTPRKSTRASSSSPSIDIGKTGIAKLRGRRPSVTEKVVPMEAIDETEPKVNASNETAVDEAAETASQDKKSEDKTDDEQLFKKKKAILLLKLQTIPEKSVTEETPESQEETNTKENNTEEAKTKSSDDLKSTDVEKPTENGAPSLTSKMSTPKYSLSLKRSAENNVEDELEMLLDEALTKEDKESPKITDGKKSVSEDSEESFSLKLDVSSPTKVALENVKQQKELVKSPIVILNRETVLDHSGSSATSDKENQCIETPEKDEMGKMKLVVITENLKLDKSPIDLKNLSNSEEMGIFGNRRKSRRGSSFYEPMDVDEYSSDNEPCTTPAEKGKKSPNKNQIEKSPMPLENNLVSNRASEKTSDLPVEEANVTKDTEKPSPSKKLYFDSPEVIFEDDEVFSNKLNSSSPGNLSQNISTNPVEVPNITNDNPDSPKKKSVLDEEFTNSTLKPKDIRDSVNEMETSLEDRIEETSNTSIKNLNSPTTTETILDKEENKTSNTSIKNLNSSTTTETILDKEENKTEEKIKDTDHQAKSTSPEKSEDLQAITEKETSEKSADNSCSSNGGNEEAEFSKDSSDSTLEMESANIIITLNNTQSEDNIENKKETLTEKTKGTKSDTFTMVKKPLSKTPVKKKPKKDNLDSMLDHLVASQEQENSNSSYESVSHYVDDMAEEGEEDTPSDGSNDIIDHGESVGSSDEEFDSDDSYENDSFIDDDDEAGRELLSGEEYDLDQETKKPIVKRKRSRIIEITDSEEEDKDVPAKNKPTVAQPAAATMIVRNGTDEDSDLEKMSMRPYCGLTPPSIMSLNDSLSENDKMSEMKDNESSSGDVVINSEDNLKSLEQLKQQESPRKIEKVTLVPVINIENVTPNNSILEENPESNKSIRQRHSSLTIHENIKLKDIEEGNISDRISKVVGAFCSSVKDTLNPSGDISLNISVEYLNSTPAEVTTMTPTKPEKAQSENQNVFINLQSHSTPAEVPKKTLLSNSSSKKIERFSVLKITPKKIVEETSLSKATPKKIGEFSASKATPEKIGEFSASKATPKKIGEFSTSKATPKKIGEFSTSKTTPEKIDEFSASKASPKKIGEFSASKATPKKIGEFSTSKATPEKIGEFSASKATPKKIGEFSAPKATPKKVEESSKSKISVSSDSNLSDDLDDADEFHSNSSEEWSDYDTFMDDTISLTNEETKKAKRMSSIVEVTTMPLSKLKKIEALRKAEKDKADIINLIEMDEEDETEDSSSSEDDLVGITLIEPDKSDTSEKNLDGKRKRENLKQDLLFDARNVLDAKYKDTANVTSKKIITRSAGSLLHDVFTPEKIPKRKERVAIKCTHKNVIIDELQNTPRPSTKKDRSNNETGKQDESTFQYFPSQILNTLPAREKVKKIVEIKKPRLLPSTTMNKGTAWKSDLPGLPLKPSSSCPIPAKKIKLDFHDKDFKNKMLYDPSRVNRVNTKEVLKRKEKMKF